MTRFRYFAVSENAQFACNSDPNLVNWEASLFYLKLVLFRPCLASAWVKKEEDLTFCRRNRGTQRQFSENICSEDDLSSRILGTFVVKFLACLPLLGFSNIYKMV